MGEEAAWISNVAVDPVAVGVGVPLERAKEYKMHHFVCAHTHSHTHPQGVRTADNT